jgi:adenine-specific DNA-methyltransferase
MQLELIENVNQVELPSTRYQGSKAKIADWIWHSIGGLRFDSVLDAFGGTGSVSYYLKWKRKAVTYNDYLLSNAISAKALIENQTVQVSAAEVDQVLEGDNASCDFVERMFDDIFFLPDENRWIDRISANIRALPDGFQRAIFYRALFQSCIVKRPYNLFHRKNLYMRTADVERNFGNKATWDTPFENHFRSFVSEANRLVFDSGTACRSLSLDVDKVPGHYDLVYIDPPYVNAAGIGIDYRDFYHFLEGLADYDAWPDKIDITRKHRPLTAVPSPWTRGKTVLTAFDTICRRHADSILAISYRSDGTPSEEKLADLLRRYKRHVEILHYGSYKYALSRNDGSREILILGHNG